MINFSFVFKIKRERGDEVINDLCHVPLLFSY